jgi:hypothetical protein
MFPGLAHIARLQRRFLARAVRYLAGDHLRSPEEIARFFDGLTLVPPGVVTTSQWRPDLADASAEPREVDATCGAGRKD